MKDSLNFANGSLDVVIKEIYRFPSDNYDRFIFIFQRW